MLDTDDEKPLWGRSDDKQRAGHAVNFRGLWGRLGLGKKSQKEGQKGSESQMGKKSQKGSESSIASMAVPAKMKPDTRFMVTVPRARLGNRLFEVAAMLAIADEAGAYAVIPDHKYNPQNTPQLSKLAPLFMAYDDVWKISDHLPTKCHVWDRTPVQVDNISKLLQWTLPGQLKGDVHVKASVDPKPGDNWAAAFAEAIRTTQVGTTPCRVTELDGFYQKNEFFQSKIDLIKDVFWHEEIAEQAKKVLDDIVPARATPVGLHLRLTDYVQSNRNLEMSYYEEALKVVQERNRGKALTCVIFSDDIAAAMTITENLAACKEFIPVEKWKGKLAGKRKEAGGWEADDKTSFYMMSQLPNLVLADSTYSYWAARLSRKNPLVVAPVLNNKFKEAYSYLKVPGWVNIETTAGLANEETKNALNLHALDSEAALSEWAA